MVKDSNRKDKKDREDSSEYSDRLVAINRVSKNNICFAQVLLADINDFNSMNEVYLEWLEGVDIPPARAAFEAGNLPKKAGIEIVIQATE